MKRTDRPTIDVLRPGALTTVQDLGRPGHAASGVPRGGAFDPWAARAANRLVGNPDGAALLEITLAGPTLVFAGVAAIALVGDSFQLELDSSGVDGGERLAAGAAAPISLQGTTRVTILRVAAGARAWLAVAGGIDVPEVLGSRSTDLAAGFGGHRGRALRVGDRLACHPSPAHSGSCRRREAKPVEAAPGRLRILEGPERRLLPRGDLGALGAHEFTVDPRSDRRGVRLGGSSVALAPHEPLRSQGILPGAVQIPPSGEPIVLGVDAPVTGGYPWVAQVIAADVGRLAHLAPGVAVRFEVVTREAAEAALEDRERELAARVIEA